MTHDTVIFACNNKLISMYVYGGYEHISGMIRRDKAFYENRALQAVKERVPMLNRLVLDVGANIGNHSVFFSDICGASVIAFEPNTDNYAVLMRNSLNRKIIPMKTLIGNAETYEGAGGDERNMGVVSYKRTEGGEFALPIDRLGLNDVALIKVDVEGMEYEVLHGAVQTIQRCQPAIMIEINGGDAMQFLNELGYEIHGLPAHTNTVLALMRQ